MIQFGVHYFLLGTNVCHCSIFLSLLLRFNFNNHRKEKKQGGGGMGGKGDWDPLNDGSMQIGLEGPSPFYTLMNRILLFDNDFDCDYDLIYSQKRLFNVFTTNGNTSYERYHQNSISSSDKSCSKVREAIWNYSHPRNQKPVKTKNSYLYHADLSYIAPMNDRICLIRQVLLSNECCCVKSKSAVTTGGERVTHLDFLRSCD